MLRNEACEKHYAGKAAVQSLEAAYESEEIVRQREVTVGLLDLKRGEVVLDIGCGVGQLTTMLAALVGNAGRAVGVDTSAAMIERAEEKWRLREPIHIVNGVEVAKGEATAALGAAAAATRTHSAAAHSGEPYGVIEYQVASAAHLPFPDDTFDAITCVQVLCYIQKAQAAAVVAEMNRVLKKPSGRLLILDTDWDTRVLHSSDEARTRRMFAIADSLYGFADLHIPRKIPTFAKDAGLAVASVQGFTLVQAGSFSPGSYFDVVGWVDAYLADGAPSTDDDSSSDEAILWSAEQRKLSNDNEFFYSCTRTIFLLTPSTRSRLGGWGYR